MKTAIGLVSAIWVVFLVDWALWFVDLSQWGLVPRTLWGVAGIATSPFLHGGLGHIVSNTVPLFVLTIFLALSSSNLKTVEIVGALLSTGGILLWLFGRYANHIGASGLVYGLAAYLVVAGFTHGKPLATITSLVVIFLYSSLLYGLFPTQSGVSWDGHLLYAVGGALVALGVKMENENENENDDES